MTNKLIRVEMYGKLFYGWRDEGVTQIYFGHLLTAFPSLQKGVYTHYLSSRGIELTQCTPKQKAAYCNRAGKDSKNLSMITSSGAKKFFKHFSQKYKPQKRQIQDQTETQPETDTQPEIQKQPETQKQLVAAPVLQEIYQKTTEQIDKMFEIQSQTLSAFGRKIRMGEQIEFSNALNNYNLAKKEFSTLVETHDNYLTVFRESIKDLSTNIVRSN